MERDKFFKMLEELIDVPVKQINSCGFPFLCVRNCVTRRFFWCPKDVGLEEIYGEKHYEVCMNVKLLPSTKSVKEKEKRETVEICPSFWIRADRSGKISNRVRRNSNISVHLAGANTAKADSGHCVRS